jgi:hypothetical protein
MRASPSGDVLLASEGSVSVQVILVLELGVRARNITAVALETLDRV